MFKKGSFQFCSIFLVFILLIFFASSASFGAEKKSFTWGTGSSTSGLFPYFVATAKVINEKVPEINVTVRSTGGGVFNTRLLEKREVGIGAFDTKIAWEAIHGEGVFAGKPFPDLRLLYVFMTNPMQFVVSEKSGIKDIYGLEGKLFTPGSLGSSGEQISMAIFRILGVHPKLRHSSHADAVEAMKNETIVGFGKYGAPDSSIIDVASAMKIRILSLSDNDIEKVLKNTAGHRRVVVPAGMYPGVGEFQSVENEWSDYVRTDFSAELAYKWVKAVWESRAEIQKICPMFTGNRLTEVSLGVKVGHMHPGAIRFYRELGLKVPKTLVPPEMGEK